MNVQEANYLLKHFSREELTSVDMFGLDWLTQCVYQDNFPVAKLLVENGFDKARAKLVKVEATELMPMVDLVEPTEMMVGMSQMAEMVGKGIMNIYCTMMVIVAPMADIS